MGIEFYWSFFSMEIFSMLKPDSMLWYYSNVQISVWISNQNAMDKKWSRAWAKMNKIWSMLFRQKLPIWLGKPFYECLFVRWLKYIEIPIHHIEPWCSGNRWYAQCGRCVCSYLNNSVALLHSIQICLLNTVLDATVG